jgi:hypothetical protein
MKLIKNATVIFFDLLGFSNHTKESIESTLNLLDSFDYILNEKRLDSKEISDNFKYLIPFSDSYVIVSNETDNFIKELSNLLYRVFMLNEILFREYNSDPNNNKKVLKQSILLNNQGKIEKRINSEFVYPFLVRGGIAFGDVYIIKRNYINNSEYYNCRIDITGDTYVNAVKLLENKKIKNFKKLKGPRIFFKNDFYEQIKDKRFIRKISDNIYELLWPAYIYKEENHKNYEINNNFNEIFRVAYDIWLKHKKEKYEYHYLNFMQLLIDSAVKFFNIDEDKEIAETLNNILKKYEKKGIYFQDFQIKSRSTPL